MRAIHAQRSRRPLLFISIGLAAFAVGVTASTALAAGTKLTRHQVAELNACLDQQNKKVTSGPDHCAAFVALARGTFA